MKRVQKELGLKVGTEVASAKHVYECLKYGLDYLWIGARTTANPFLMQELADAYGVAVGTTKQDTINAIEDMICDELALETAFEGNRWYDLKRMATHKNESGLYGGNFGGRWLARKLAFKQPVVNLEDKNNWYLPFK